jgi:hypothetical protein
MVAVPEADRSGSPEGPGASSDHFTPTGSSWMNLVERFFADLTGDVIRHGSFTSVRELVRDIKTYLEQGNSEPKPYKWKAKGAEILATRAALDAHAVL